LKIVAIVQARMNSSRFPGKVMEQINGVPLIELLLSRLANSKKINSIILAIPETPEDLALRKHAELKKFEVFSGSTHDVLDRYYSAAKKTKADVIVRITGDCPLIDPALVDEVIQFFQKNALDYATNAAPPTYPDGLDTEVFSFQALERAWNEADGDFEREHVTPYIRESGKFRTDNYTYHTNYSDLRWTVDEHTDLAVIKNVFNYFAPDIHFGFTQVLALEEKHPELFSKNKKIKRNEGAFIGTGQKLWKRAKNIIPGGNMLLSKRSEMFLPDAWPSYFSKAKGCTIWDLDNLAYTDMTIMGIGTNTLGYGHPEVDKAVLRVVEQGNMSTLNCPEEVYLAEKLIELHPWADMVRFARSGGEANAISIRIARAATGKDKVAFCGYHGWHDWYLAANLGDEKVLAGHLLPGLEPNGVPQGLSNTIFPFTYNKIEELEKLVLDHDIGIIKMEVSRTGNPANGFLEKVRKIADKNGIVLIFDECTSGFRQTFGGLHKDYGVEPDMAMFGKALGNGYAITATIGKREIMEAAQTSFISSTFWTERIGPSAGLKTLEVMEQIRSWDQITKTGLEIKKKWQNLADSFNLEIEQWGLPALAGFTFKSPLALEYKTLMTQEMLKKGFLVGNSVYVCTEHTHAIVDEYINKLSEVFSLIKECEEGRDVCTLLEGPVCHAGFKRLN
jgi:glutamate-1-semialdehyde 2,1-aminomutase